MIGKYVLEHWVNGDYETRGLRLITRENKRYYVADVQRYFKDFEKGVDLRTFNYKWAAKFTKCNNELGFKRSITHLSNTDGTMRYQVFDSPAECKCPYTFDEVFSHDVRDIQDKDNSPLREYARLEELGHGRDYKIKPDKCELSDHPIDGWDTEIVKKMMELFNVTDVYEVRDRISEYRNKSILTKSATLLHIIHFNLEKKEITFDENYNNRTIIFWLFDDKLVFQYEEGKDTF